MRRDMGKMNTTCKERILLMDDEQSVRQVASEILGHIGYEVTAVEDGAEAVRLYAEAKGTAHPYDVVILNLTIRSSIGGREVIQKLKEINPEVKAIASSGYRNDPIMTEPGDYGFKAAIPKPYTVKELEETLHKVIIGAENRTWEQ